MIVTTIKDTYGKEHPAEVRQCSKTELVTMYREFSTAKLLVAKFKWENSQWVNDDGLTCQYVADIPEGQEVPYKSVKINKHNTHLK